MKRFIYILSFLAVALFVLAMASSINANTVDPKIIIQNNTGCGSGCTNFISGTSFSFITPDGFSCNFTSPSGAPGDCAVNNAGTATWTAITFDISPLQSPLSCFALNFFSNCVIGADGDGDIEAVFSGGAGVPPNNVPDLLISISGWTAGTTFDATISTPEPGSLALLLTGGGFFPFFLAWRRRRSVSHA